MGNAQLSSAAIHATYGRLEEVARRLGLDFLATQEEADSAMQALIGDPRLVVSAAYILSGSTMDYDDYGRGWDGETLAACRDRCVDAVIGFFDQFSPASAERLRQMVRMTRQRTLAANLAAAPVASILERLYGDLPASSG